VDKTGISTKAVLAYLSIKMMGFKKTDRKITNDTNVNFLQTTQLAGTYQKRMMLESDVFDIIRIARAAREDHRRLTRVWSTEHWRLLPSPRIMEYTNIMRTHRSNFEVAVKDIQNRWADIIAKQQDRLKSSNKQLFLVKDYPWIISDKNEIRGWRVSKNIDLMQNFKFEYMIRTITDEKDIILEIEKETIDEIKQMVKTENERNLKESMVHLWAKLEKKIANIADVCMNDKRVFDTLLGTIEDDLELFRDLNISKDQNFEKIIEKIRNSSLCGYTTGQIRKDKRLKKKIGHEAKKITDEIKIFSGVTND